MEQFKVFSKYTPAGDQVNAIQKLSEGINYGLKEQVLLGVTGSGKTFTMAKIIEQVQKPTLVLAHNKTLAAQLCNEFREFFPKNRVEFFVSYYDYYQPEAYISSTDTYIEKDSAINEEIEKLRHSATASLSERQDVIVVASVSCIFGLGNPKDYFDNQISLREGYELSQTDLIKKLLNIQYERNELEFKQGSFRVKGDSVNIFPSYSNSTYYKVEFFGDTIDKLKEIDAVTGNKIATLSHVSIYPATHYAVGGEKLKSVLEIIKKDCEAEVKAFEQKGKLIEAQRLKERTNYDLEMMSEIGYCSGIENYSRYFDNRSVGDPPYTLLDYFPDNFLLFIDESHITLPQVRGMFNGDRARKTNLVEYGFRVKSAFDNRPLTFEEFRQRLNQVVYVSATPGKYEISRAGQIVEQIIRPTGLLDPEIEVVQTKGQIEDLINRINQTVVNEGRVLITTLTKKMSELLTNHLQDNGIRVKYLHSEIDTLERIEIVNGLRAKEFDVVVGINLLREGLDIPEVKLVIILDADKEGFLRSETSLIQTIGRAARNKDAKVIMYADVITDSMKKAIDETNRRRKIQNDYNLKHNITPQTIIKDIKNTLEITKKDVVTRVDLNDIPKQIEKLRAMMKICSGNLDFEQAIKIRDQIAQLNKVLKK